MAGRSPSAPSLGPTLAALAAGPPGLGATLQLARLWPMWPQTVGLIRAYFPPRTAERLLATLRRDRHCGVVAFRDHFAAWYFLPSVWSGYFGGPTSVLAQ